ncbi:hypothetical protein [Winogradskyella aurantia]|uniref:EamA domain-containing protein n=1 Tax=Winogradskyella aurantia TaxID=1915063 RepID=A0A265UM63_9FLAO|nr:hypothetical protein [Winogradskyella aurantia]OZV66424.1 hypothetical protein CA834_14320 [Winogradskyella aurantia]
MIYLLLSVLSSTAIFVLFKLLSTYKADTLQAIVVNYITASFCGFLSYKGAIEYTSIINSSWIEAAAILGFMFISMFYVMALTAQINGLSVASVASKMSVVIPIVFGIVVFKEALGFYKIMGIVLALIAVYLTSVKEKDDAILTKSLYLPIIVFFGSGIIDTSINYFAPDDKIPLFSAIIFSIAGVVGITFLSFRSMRAKKKFTLRAISFGMALGLVNYASIFFLLKALRVGRYDTSTIFTVNNVAIVAASTLAGLWVFREKISLKNYAGIVIAAVSIILVTLI